MKTITLELPDDIAAWMENYKLGDNLETTIGRYLQVQKMEEEWRALCRRVERAYSPQFRVVCKADLVKLLRRDPERNYLCGDFENGVEFYTVHTIQGPDNSSFLIGTVDHDIACHCLLGAGDSVSDPKPGSLLIPGEKYCSTWVIRDRTPQPAWSKRNARHLIGQLVVSVEDGDIFEIVSITKEPLYPSGWNMHLESYGCGYEIFSGHDCHEIDDPNLFVRATNREEANKLGKKYGSC